MPKIDWTLLDEDFEIDAARGAGKLRKARPKRDPGQVRSGLAAELYKEEADFHFTYKAARHEQVWLSAALSGFFLDSLITDVLGLVRGGKEANVYCCRAHPSTGTELLAAKVYRPRMLRNLKNDAVYKEGRAFLGDDGKNLQDHRSLRAIRKKTRVGSELTITSWIEHEFQTLRRLHQAGASVPRPVIQANNAILMGYIGEAGHPAPTLNTVRLVPGEAEALFELLRQDVERMLANDLIHADLSAYNVLYWQGTVTVIDFPQVVDPLRNPRGYDLLARDLHRLCQYFDRQGVKTDPAALAKDLWDRYLYGELKGIL
jgi:RIO kinase 1